MNRMRRRTLLAAAVSTLLVVSLTACAADVAAGGATPREPHGPLQVYAAASLSEAFDAIAAAFEDRSEEHTSELQSLMRISYAVFCLNKKRSLLREKKTQTII